jgi:hypothetical protein
MKIIGNNSDNYIVEIKKSELVNLLGFYSQYDTEPRDIIKMAMDSGSDIQISKIYRQLYSLAQNKSRAEETVLKLEEMIKTLTVISPVLFTETGEET